MQYIIEVVTTTGRVVHRYEGDGQEFITLFHSGEPWSYGGTRYHILKSTADWIGAAPRLHVQVTELVDLSDRPRRKVRLFD